MREVSGTKRGQIWVETVIYTLIAFTLIGLVLSFAKPKIEEIQDKVIIEQSIKMLEDIDSTISSIIQGGAGNKRQIELGIKKGTLKIDGVNDKIIFEMESIYQYSEPGENFSYGNIIAYTEKRGKYNMINLTNDYGGKYDIRYNGENELKLISKASTPYNLFLLNKNGTVVDIEIN